MNLHAVLLLELNILLVEGVDTVNHGLDELDLGVAKTVLVGDVVGVAGLTAGLTTGAARLDVEFLATLLQEVDTLLGPSGEIDVDRGAHAGTQVGGARVDVAELLREHEVLAGFGLDGVTDSLDTAGKALEDTLDVTALLHGDDAELILLVDPDKEGLVGVVEDTTTLGPVTLHTSDLQVGVTRHEEEVVVDELLADGLIHTSQGVVVTSQISFQLGESVLHEGLNINTLLLGDAGGKTESLDGTADTDSAGVNWDIGFNVGGDFGGIHVRGVLEISTKTMVFADEGVENISEVNVRIFVTSIDTAMLVIEFNGASNSLGQGEARGLGDVITQFSPFFGGDVLGSQRVGGLDFGEWCHGLC